VPFILAPTEVRVIVEAFILGCLAQVSLLLAGLGATVVHVPKKVVGAMAGFGAGALVSAVSFDLVDQAKVIGAIRHRLAARGRRDLHRRRPDRRPAVR